ncbi:MAG: GIY-YIG nuclease family protein, partial [Pantoea piersonii]
MNKAWQLYIVQTAAGVLYTGITTDVARRVEQHESGRGAR